MRESIKGRVRGCLFSMLAPSSTTSQPRMDRHDMQWEIDQAEKRIKEKEKKKAALEEKIKKILQEKGVW